MKTRHPSRRQQTRQESRLNNYEFRALLDLFMASDPTPLKSDADEIVARLLYGEAQARGYDTWTIAYHEHMKDKP